jgi:uncharacterized membrane protein YebE (DUF533 family)
MKGQAEPAEASPGDLNGEAGAPEAPRHDEGLVQILASKVLMDWLRNRQQLLVPLALDLQKLEPPAAEMLLRAMVTAAHADGALDEGDRRRLAAALKRLNASDDQRAGLADLTAQRKPLGELIAGVADAETGAMVYAASLLASDRRKRVNRYYLRYLAERLNLSKDLARSLEQRFNAGL